MPKLRCTSRSGWWLIARTKIIDDAIAEAIADGCDRVLNLAAGLDTRPYRLDLPADFPWIEADLPELLAEKTQLLADQTPRCRLTRSAVDLADPAARNAFFDEALDGATKALVLTEGLLMYLEDRDVKALSDAITRPEVAWWMFDFGGPGLKRLMNKKMAGMLQNAPFIFAPDNGLAYFEDLGWRVIESEWLMAAANRFRRLPIFMRPLAVGAATQSTSPGQKALECHGPPYPGGVTMVDSSEQRTVSRRELVKHGAAAVVAEPGTAGCHARRAHGIG